MREWATSLKEFEAHFHLLWTHAKYGDDVRCGWSRIVCLFRRTAPLSLCVHVIRNCSASRGKNVTEKCRQARNKQHNAGERTFFWLLLGVAFCLATIWISFCVSASLLAIAHLYLCYYYYYYSRSSKTIALGNWGLSSKLCFNVSCAKVHSMRTVQSVSIYVDVRCQTRRTHTHTHMRDFYLGLCFFFTITVLLIPPISMYTWNGWSGIFDVIRCVANAFMWKQSDYVCTIGPVDEQRRASSTLIVEVANERVSEQTKWNDSQPNGRFGVHIFFMQYAATYSGWPFVRWIVCEFNRSREWSRQI